MRSNLLRAATRRRGFSLVELLVVIGIIALLIGILAPTLSGARRASFTTACLSNLRQIGQATLAYCHDHGGRFPRSSHSALPNGVMPWGHALMPYFGREPYSGPGPAWDDLFNSLYRCPADDRRNLYSYGKNVWFELTSGETGELIGAAEGPTYPKLNNVRQSSATVLFGEVGSGAMVDHVMAHFWYLGGEPEVDKTRHGRTSNYAFVDGHAEARAFETTFNLSQQIDNWHPAKAH